MRAWLKSSWKSGKGNLGLGGLFGNGRVLEAVQVGEKKIRRDERLSQFPTSSFPARKGIDKVYSLI